MSAQSMDLFSEVCYKVSNKLYFEELMIKQQQFFDIQPYKIDKLYSEPAKKLYKQICHKYQITKELATHPNLWHQNQRKIFIWFIVCYFHELGAQDPLQTNIDWTLMSEMFFLKSPSFLKFQFMNIIKPKKRIGWTIEEDLLLTKATDQQGIGKWNEISKALFFDSDCRVFKSPKHCRQRWLNHLDRNKNKGKWTDEEDYKILNYVKQYGKKWSKIVQVLNHTRTQHMIKNRFNSLLTKNRKNKKQKQMQTVGKIVRLLEKTLNLSCETQRQEKLKTQVYDQVQLQNSEQSQQNPQRIVIENKEEKQMIQNQIKERKIFFSKKSSFQLASFQTMAISMNFGKSYGLENLVEKTQQPHQFNTSCQSLLFLFNDNQKDPINQQKSRGCSRGCSRQVQNFDSERPNKIIYKTKPVYIIQHNF